MVDLLAVLGTGALEIWAAVPLGLALRMPPLEVAVATFVGAVAGAAIVIALGDRARSWLLRRRPAAAADAQRPGLMRRVWNRYGLPGLGLLAPLVTGAPLGAALGLALGARPGPLLLWISIGAAAWTAGLTLVGALGAAGIAALFH